MLHLIFAASMLVLTAPPSGGPVPRQAAPAPARQQASKPAAKTDALGEAYYQFITGRRLADEGDAEGAVKAFTRAGELDPDSADIPAELAELYRRMGRVREAIQWAETALTKDPGHGDAHRLLGYIYAELSARDERGAGGAAPTPGAYQRQAIDHLERSLADASQEDAAGARLMLGRLLIQAQSYDKAIAVLKQLLADEPWLPQGVAALSQAYAEAGRGADAIALLKDAATMEPSFYETLGEAYEKERRWTEAAEAYEKAAAERPNDIDLKTRWASALLSTEERASTVRARDLLLQVTKSSPAEAWPLYLLARAQRELGDLDASEASARKLLAISPASTSGAHALAQVLEARREWAKIVTALEPIAAKAVKGREADTALILTHLGFAYLELGRQPDAIDAFQRAIALNPADADLKAYLAQALVAAKQYDKALTLVRSARAGDATDLRLARLEAEALRGMGRVDEGAAILRKLIGTAAGDPAGVQTLAEYYAGARQYAEAAAVLKAAQATFPGDLNVLFQYGAMLERQKLYADAERVFRQIIAQDPRHAPSLNYLGYTMVERGTRLEEAVVLIKRALDVDPHNGAYLDSLGWAYVKLNQFDLAEAPLRAAAERLPRDSVVQEHWGDLLARKGRFAEAIDAWRRALAGDGDQIDRAAIERKVREAASKPGKD